MSDPADSSGQIDDNETGGISRIKARFGFANDKGSMRKKLLEALANTDEQTREFSKQESMMLLNTLHFSSTRIEDVMIPRADIKAIEIESPLTELLALFEEEEHSRIPVYRGTLDDIAGMIHIKDFLSWMTRCAIEPNQESNDSGGTGKQAEKKSKVDLSKVDLTLTIDEAKITREVPFIPASLFAVQLLSRMQSTRNHMAMVVDEYGGTDGLVTIEDLVEEIVGEIEDEHDDVGEDLIEQHDVHGLIASARISIEELEQALEQSLALPENEEEPHTLGGLVFLLAGHIPVRGEIISHPGGIEFEVLEADSRKIKKLKVTMRGNAKEQQQES